MAMPTRRIFSEAKLRMTGKSICALDRTRMHEQFSTNKRRIRVDELNIAVGSADSDQRRSISGESVGCLSDYGSFHCLLL